ncbi:MAG: SET domain-containing protein [Stellaceae bacterium]
MPAAAGRPPLLSIPDQHLEIREHPVRGRGIFAREPIAAGSLIEAAPVIVIPVHQCRTLDRTVMHDYYFHWDGDPDGEGRGALALGLVSLCNHSAQPRARVVRNFERRTLDLVALSAIEESEEVTIDYNCPLWFEPSE